MHRQRCGPMPRKRCPFSHRNRHLRNLDLCHKGGFTKLCRQQRQIVLLGKRPKVGENVDDPSLPRHHCHPHMLMNS